MKSYEILHVLGIFRAYFYHDLPLKWETFRDPLLRGGTCGCLQRASGKSSPPRSGCGGTSPRGQSVQFIEWENRWENMGKPSVKMGKYGENQPIWCDFHGFSQPWLMNSLCLHSFHHASSLSATLGWPQALVEWCLIGMDTLGGAPPVIDGL